MLKLYVTMYRNLRNNQHYRVTKKYGVECRCPLSGEWYPSPMTEETLMSEAVSYTITQQTFLGRIVSKASTVTLFLCRRFRGGVPS